ncbi:MAG: hypothetical protein IT440_08345 [Phycisphaeraceae bacterium]|nr:hypothetical protein [Phycisphaeraceae bacterium]
MWLAGGHVYAYLNQEMIESVGTYADGSWHHVAYTFGSAIPGQEGQQLYVDGEWVASGSVNTPGWENSISNVCLGMSFRTTTSYVIDTANPTGYAHVLEEVEHAANGADADVEARAIPFARWRKEGPSVIPCGS